MVQITHIYFSHLKAMYWRETTRFLGDLLTLQVTIHVWYIYLDFVDYGKLVHKYVPYIHGAHIGYNSATKKTLTMTYSLVNDGILISWFIIIIIPT